MKDSPTSTLIKAIRSILAGGYWVGRDRVASLVDALRLRQLRAPGQPAPHHGLTDRELLIISGVVAAFGNRDIGQRLGITEKTVKAHLTNIFDKLGVSTRTELAMYAVRNRLPLTDYPAS